MRKLVYTRSLVRRPSVRIQAPLPLLRGTIGLVVAYLILRACVGCTAANAFTPSQDADSGPESAPSYYVQGTRLRFRILTATDGTQAPFGGWYDSQLRTPCIFQQTADAGFRCLSIDSQFDAGSLQLSDYVGASVSP